MPVVSQRGSSRRRTINEINMVPFIDVMLVLLIIFMVTAPLITTGVVDLPTAGMSVKAPEPHFIELTVAADGTLRLRVDGHDQGMVSMTTLAQRVRDVQEAYAPTPPVVISADRSVRYESVVKAMDTLQRAGIKRVGLLVKTTGAGTR